MKKEKKKASGFEIIVSLIIVGVAIFMIYRMATGGLNKKEEPTQEPPFELNLSFDEAMRNDTTGKWRLARVSTDHPVADFIQYYYNTYMVPYPGTHVIVNFTLNTTSIVNDYGSFINIDTHEYVEDEEHDAKVCPSGMLYTTEHIDKETWKVTETIYG